MQQPDFVVIPTQVLMDDKLQPLDRVIFGYIYWLTKLKEGECTASNKTIADLAKCSARVVQNSLTRLEQSGWIKRGYADDNPKQRVRIECLVQFRPVSSHDDKLSRGHDKLSSHDDKGVSSNDDQNKSSNLSKSSKEDTTNVVDGKRPGSPAINRMFDLWEQTVGYPVTGKRQQNRNFCSTLLKTRGEEGLAQLVKGVALAHDDQFAPRITDFVSLYYKQNDLIVWGKQRSKTHAIPKF